MLKPVPGKDFELDEGLKKYFEYRFDTVDQRLENVFQHLDKLSSAIITREVFNEVRQELNDIEKRIRYLESQVAIGRVLVAGLTTVVTLLLAEFIRGLFP